MVDFPHSLGQISPDNPITTGKFSESSSLVLLAACGSDDSTTAPPAASEFILVHHAGDSLHVDLDDLPSFAVDDLQAVQLDDLVNEDLIPPYTSDEESHDARRLYAYQIEGEDGFSAHRDRGYPNNTLDQMSLGRHFSYGELTMTDDSEAVMLAYARSELLPAKLPADQTYPWSRHRDPLSGLRLVCPGEPDTVRYLDDVVKIELREPLVDVAGLPATQRGKRCVADTIMVVAGGVARPLSLAGVATATVEGWVRAGHGRGFKGISAATGYDLRALLSANFPGTDPSHFFLFVACDGYRAVFSGREIWCTEAGRRMLVIVEIDGEPLPDGASVGPVRDYYVDRVVRGVTHIVRLDDIR